MTLISDEYRVQNQRLHERLPIYGSKGGYKHAAKIRALLKDYQGSTVLDYGCGKASLRTVLGDKVRNYDPGVPEFAAEPEPADVVLCADVMEHVEPECLDDVLKHLRKVTRKVLFVVISCRRSDEYLDDGRNSHLIIQAHDWWAIRFADHFEIVERAPRERGAELHMVCV